VDTAVAHLAAAMAKPVWILSRFDGCWRWLNDRDDSPWYPTVRLFRQRLSGDWDEVMTRVSAALSERMAALALPASRPGGVKTASAKRKPAVVTAEKVIRNKPAPKRAAAAEVATARPASSEASATKPDTQRKKA
jgi:hypothetical protein